MGEGPDNMGIWGSRLVQPSVHDAAVMAGIVNEAASHHSSCLAVTRPRE